MKQLIDAKVLAIYFKFYASNLSLEQNLVFELENLEDSMKIYKLSFVNVSGFNFNISIGEQNLFPRLYQGDSMYIASISKVESNNNHQKWEIKLIDSLGSFVIFSDNVILND